MSNYVSKFQMPDGTVANVKDSEIRNTVSNMNRPMCLLAIGDSYLAGSQNPNPASDNWGTYVRSMLGLVPNESYFAFPGSGYGFTKSTDYNFYKLFQTAHSNLTASQRASVTDIVIGGGANDWELNSTTLANLINSFNNIKTIIDADYQSDVKIHVVAMGWNIQYPQRKDLSDMYRYYAQQCSAHGFIYHECYTLLQLRSYFNADGVHPTAGADYAIASAVCQFLKGSEMYADNNLLKWDFKVDNATKGYAQVIGKNVVIHFNEVGFNIANGGSIQEFTYVGDVDCDVLLGGLSTNGINITVPGVVNQLILHGQISTDIEMHIYKTSESANKDTLKLYVRALAYDGRTEWPNWQSFMTLEGNVVIPLPIA